MRTTLLLLACSALLAGCGRSDVPATEPVQSAGQVAPPAPVPKVSYYAASRFAEQASFGPTPALIAELQAKGFERWIDEQLAMPASTIDMQPFLDYAEQLSKAASIAMHGAFPNLAIAAPDQLRTRVTWSIGQFIVVSMRVIPHQAVFEWINMLQRQALGNYGELLYAVTVHPAMGSYLNNAQNRPKSAECSHCTPNENYARELMQLFSLGVVTLNPDGSWRREERGRPIETYTQRDVEELARVLTGWQYDPDPPNRPKHNYGNWSRAMVASTWQPERDSGAKTVLGRSFPAGQSQAQDLRAVTDLLMSHPNIAPFVALRMIQHLVKSNPSPAYLQRVANRFLDNGAGVRGDMTAVVKAVLLDPEARAGDDPAKARADDGKFREPFLHSLAIYRGLECRSVLHDVLKNYQPYLLTSQLPFHAESVFSFYAPTDRAPGSNLLAPEQRLMTSFEFRERSKFAATPLWNYETLANDQQHLFASAGCQIDALERAFLQGPGPFVEFLSKRWFRGAMPAPLRNAVEEVMAQPPYPREIKYLGALRMLSIALLSPHFGAKE